jgi:hypothetical protein
MIAAGKITGVSPREITITVPYDPRYVTQQWDEVTVDLPDGRKISPEQRRKAYALMGEIAEWAGMEPEEVKLTAKHDFVQRHLEGLHRELFSLASCDMTTARQFVTYLIDFVLQFDVPLRVPLVTLCDDIQKAVYSCLMHHKCIICGKPCELHHVDRVGMGGDRHDMCHIGMECLPLCREHHTDAHDHGDQWLMELYHLVTVVIDEKIAREYRLGKRRQQQG